MKRRFTLVTADEPIPQTADDMKAHLSLLDRVLQESPDENDEDVEDIDGTQLRSHIQLFSFRLTLFTIKRFVLFLSFVFL